MVYTSNTQDHCGSGLCPLSGTSLILSVIHHIPEYTGTTSMDPVYTLPLENYHTMMDKVQKVGDSEWNTCVQQVVPEFSPSEA
jgi:hypothetical protein